MTLRQTGPQAISLHSGTVKFTLACCRGRLVAIAFISYEIYPTTPGGVGAFVTATTRMLLRNGHDVALILDLSTAEFRAWTQSHSKRVIDGSGTLQSYQADDLCADIELARENFPSEAHWKSYRFAWCLKKVHLKQHLDFAEFIDYCGAAYYSLIERAHHPDAFPGRIAIRLHNTIEVIARRTESSFEDFRLADFALERAALAMVDVVLSSGQAYFDEEIATLYTIDRRRLHLSPLVCEVREPVVRREQARDVLFVGRLSTFKGLDRFLHAAVAILSDAAVSDTVGDFIVIGPSETVSSGQSEAALLAIAAGHLGERIKILGRLGHDQIRRHYETASCAVFANRMESFCYAAHEAHLAGVPLVLTEIPTFRDFFVDAETALLVDGSVSSLVRAILRLATDRELNHRLSISRAATVTRYTQDHYPRHTAIAPFEPALSQTGETCSDLSVVVVHETAKDTDATAADIAALLAALPGVHAVQLRPGETGSRVPIFGDFYALSDRDGAGLVVQTVALRSHVVFVYPNRLPDAAFLRAALGILTAMPIVGAVCPARTDSDGTVKAARLPIALEAAEGESVALIGAVFRTGRPACLVDLVTDPGPTSELAILWSIQAKGSLVVDWPATRVSRALHPERLFQPADWQSFLRRHAWTSDTVAAAAQMSTTKALAAMVRTLTPAEVASMRISAALQQSLDHADWLYVLPNLASPSTAAARPADDAKRGYTTLVQIFPGSSAATVPWRDCTFEGPWEDVISLDHPAGLRRSKAGSCLIHGFARGRLMVLVGPDQDQAVLVQHGRAVLVDFRRSHYHDVLLDIEALLSLDTHRLVHAIDVLNPPRSTSDPTQDRSEGALAVVVLAGDARLPLARALARALGVARPLVTVEPDVNPDRAARALVEQASVAGIQTYVLVDGPDTRHLVGKILNAAPRLSCILLATSGIGWQHDGYSGFKALAQFKQSFGTRLTIRIASDGLSGLFQARGIAVDEIALPPLTPQPAWPVSVGPIDLVIGAGSGEVPSLGHVAAALMVLHPDTLARIGDILLPGQDAQLGIVLRRFGLGHRLQRYDGLGAAIRSRQDRRFIYLAPFPDSILDGFAYLALETGGLVLVGADAVDLDGFPRREALQIVYWEQADELAGRLTTLVDGYTDVRTAMAEWVWPGQVSTAMPTREASVS